MFFDRLFPLATLWRFFKRRKFRVNPKHSPKSPSFYLSDYFDLSDNKSQKVHDWMMSGSGVNFYDESTSQGNDAFDSTVNSKTDKEMPTLKHCPVQVRSIAKRSIEEQLKVTSFKKVGQGAFGVVLKVRSTERSDRKAKIFKAFALKIITAKWNRSNYLQRWAQNSEREMTIMKSLNHENVLHYYGSTWLGNHLSSIPCYLVIKTEYLDCDLANCLKKLGKIESMSTVLRLLLQVGDAVAYLHSRKVIHHDIKPANIMIKLSNHTGSLEKQLRTSIFKIIDFGLARTYRSMEHQVKETKNRYGTRRYFSPEKADKKQEYDPYLADAFALGVTALEITQGPLWLWSMIRDSVDTPTHQPDEPCTTVEHLCLRLLSSNPHMIFFEILYGLLAKEEMRVPVNEWLNRLQMMAQNGAIA